MRTSTIKIIKFLPLLLLTLFSLSVHAQSQLTPCQTSGIKNNCFAEFVFSDGAKYIGDWQNGKRDGQGVLTWADGTKYSGYWLEDKQNGQGILTWNSGKFKGDKYEGEWKQGKQNGKGTYFFADGGQYIGGFVDGKHEGIGTHIYAGGSKYVGEVKDGKYSGEGLLTYANGTIYKGSFLDGKHSGRGVLTFQNGSKMDGEFANGKFLSGSVIYVDGTSYVGGFQDGKKNGKGILYNKDGSVKYSGIWSNDVPNQPSESKAVVAKNSARPLLDTVEEEKTCESIGFKRKTEAFANCVLELMDRNKSNIASGDPDDFACRGYGFKPKTPDYATCRQKIDMARQNAQRQQSQFAEQNRLYEEQIAMQKKEIKRANNQRALDLSLRLLNGQSPTDAVLGAGTGAPIRPSNSQLIQMPNGKMMDCITVGSLTECF